MDSLSLAGVIGTWVGVGLALFALVGIAGPLIVLLQTRSERYRALEAVDTQNTGFITPGWRLGSKIRLFRHSKVPLLSKPPNITTKFRVPEQAKFNNPSLTGWVNLAEAIEAYVFDLPRGDALVIDHTSTYLPVNRFWLLALGLFGRYSTRDDKGRRVLEANDRRFAFDHDPATSDDSGFDFMISGLTGFLDQYENRGDTDGRKSCVIFKPHRPHEMQGLDPDPPSLQELFWLSLGCLPFRQGSLFQAIDVGSYVSSYSSQIPGLRARGGKVFLRLAMKSSDDPTQSMWAKAMGVDLKNIWCFERIADTPVTLAIRRGKSFMKEYNTLDPDAQANEMHKWWPFGSKMHVFTDDIYKIALAALSVTLSPHSFLFDWDRNLLLNILRRDYDMDGLGQLVLLGEQFKVHLTLNEKERAAWDGVSSLSSTARTTPGSGFYHFSRRSAQACYEFEKAFKSRKWELPERVRTILQMIILTRGRKFLFAFPVSSGGPCYIEINTKANYVRVWQALAPQSHDEVESWMVEREEWLLIEKDDSKDPSLYIISGVPRDAGEIGKRLDKVHDYEIVEHVDESPNHSDTGHSVVYEDERDSDTGSSKRRDRGHDRVIVEHADESLNHSDAGRSVVYERGSGTQDYKRSIRKILEASSKPKTIYFNYRSVFADDPHMQQIESRVYTANLDFVFCVMCAMVRREALLNVLDSRPLLQFIRDREDIPLVGVQQHPFKDMASGSNPDPLVYLADALRNHADAGQFSTPREHPKGSSDSNDQFDMERTSLPPHRL